MRRRDAVTERALRGPTLLAATVLVGAGLVLWGGGPATASPTPNPDTFATAGAYDYYVPAGVTSIEVTAVGAAGGGVKAGVYEACTNASGGEGAEVTAAVSVTPGEHLLVGVGSAGADGTCGSVTTGGAGGSNGGKAPSGDTVPGGGGGAGGDAVWNELPGAGGGGASLVSTASGTPLVVAGGGGGAGGDGAVGGGNAGMPGPDATTGATGGGAGGLTGGAAGTPGTCIVNSARLRAASVSYPGLAGSGLTGGAGGAGADTPTDVSGGGGGGGAGYFGGGGGGGNQCDGDGAGGGGGSSYVAGQGVVAGAATAKAAGVTISYTLTPPPPPPEPPTAVITVPAAGATLAQGQVVFSSFACTEGANGPGIASCLDGAGAASGQQVDTSAPGPHTLTVTATSLDGLTGTATVNYDVAGPPGVTIDVPPAGATYEVGQPVASSFSCTDGADGPGLASCSSSNGSAGPHTSAVRARTVAGSHVAAAGAASGSPIDTSTPGSHIFTVTAVSVDGLTDSSSVTYHVAAPPTVSITVPSAGQTFTVGHSVAAAFSCAEGAGGPGLASCLDRAGHPSGAGLDTSTPGSHTLTVTATSRDGLTATTHVSYTVVAAAVAAATAAKPASPPVVVPAAVVQTAGQPLAFTGAWVTREEMAAAILLLLGGAMVLGSRRTPCRARYRAVFRRRSTP